MRSRYVSLIIMLLPPCYYYAELRLRFQDFFHDFHDTRLPFLYAIVGFSRLITMFFFRRPLLMPAARFIAAFDVAAVFFYHTPLRDAAMPRC